MFRMAWWNNAAGKQWQNKMKLFRTEELPNPRYSTWVINFREIPIDGIIFITIPLFFVCWWRKLFTYHVHKKVNSNLLWRRENVSAISNASPLTTPVAWIPLRRREEGVCCCRIDPLLSSRLRKTCGERRMVEDKIMACALMWNDILQKCG